MIKLLLFCCFLTLINGQSTTRSAIFPTKTLSPSRNNSTKLVEVTTINSGTTQVSTTKQPRHLRTTTPVTTVASIPVTKEITTTPVTLIIKDLGETSFWYLTNYKNQQIDNKQILCGANLNDDHPWLVLIEHSDPTHANKRKTLSKGVLIDSKHVLTTVSSLHNSHPFWIVTGVRLGDYITWGTTGVSRNRSCIVTVGIDKVFMHKTKDVAIIRLNESINITDAIQPICLPTTTGYNFHQMYLHICKKTYRKNKPPLAEISLESVLPLSPQDCTTMFHRQNANITTNEFCAWDQRGDTCTGDLGGPLIVKYSGVYFVIGLTSYIHSQKILSSDKFPGVYIRVGSHLNWINKVINE